MKEETLQLKPHIKIIKRLLWILLYQQIGQPRIYGKLLEMYISKLNHEEIRNLNRLITSKQNESVSKNLPTSKSTGPDNFTNKSYQTFQKELTLLLKLFQK